MAYEPKDMSGALFKNDKEGVETRPDRKGSCVIEGKEYWVSGWLKDGKQGQFLSLAFKPKDKQVEKLDGKRAGTNAKRDDIPW